MANLVQLADELEYVPKEQLVQMSQDPNNRFPQFLVLSEIQRRTQNENAYRASQTQPTTTVAEEVVSEFARPMGLQAGMPSESAPTDAFSSESMGMPASASMQQPMQPPMAMASGGLTGYANGGPLYQSFNNPYDGAIGTSINPYPDEETKNKVVEFVQENPWATGLNAAALIALVTPLPGGRIASGTLAGLSKAVQYGPKAFRGLKALYNKGLSRLGAGQARKDIAGGRLLPEFSSGTRNVPTPPNFYQNLGRRRLSDMRLGQRTLGAGTLATGIGYAYDEMNDTKENQDKPELTQAQQDYANLVKQNQLAALQVDDKPKKGLGAFSPTDLIQLGGAIMSARNISELGAGISGMAGMSAQRKADAEEAEINRRLREAQISQLETETALLPDKQLAQEIEGVTEAIKQAEEGMGDEETIEKLKQYRAYLIQQQALGRGYDPQTQAGTNQSLIASYT